MLACDKQRTDASASCESLMHSGYRLYRVIAQTHFISTSLKTMLQPADFRSSAKDPHLYHVKTDTGKILTPGLQPCQRRLFDFLLLGISHGFSRRSIACSRTGLHFHKSHRSLCLFWKSRRSSSSCRTTAVIHFRFRPLYRHQIQLSPAAMKVTVCNHQPFSFQERRRDFFPPSSDFLFVKNKVPSPRVCQSPMHRRPT